MQQKYFGERSMTVSSDLNGGEPPIIQFGTDTHERGGVYEERQLNRFGPGSRLAMSLDTLSREV